MRRKGFTLVELLTVMAILAILYAIFLPIAKAARGAAFQYNASNAIRQLGTSAIMYASDHDDTAPLAIYPTSTGIQTWFGLGDWSGVYNPQLGLLTPYTQGKVLKDPTHHAKEWLGDHSGFGYNWGQIGSDAHIPGGQTWYPWCVNAARITEISDPSATIMFTTSSFVNASWLPGGDGQTYDYGFVFEPFYWQGNPPMDFRHQGTKRIEPSMKQVESDGLALAVMADSHVKALKQKQVTDSMFLRNLPNSL